MGTPRKTRVEKSSEAYKKKRKKSTDKSYGNKATKHNVEKKDLPKKTGMRSYTSKLVLG